MYSHSFQTPSLICNANLVNFKNNNYKKSKTALKYTSSSVVFLTLAACGGSGGSSTQTPPPPGPTKSTFVESVTNTFIADGNLPATFAEPTSSADLTVYGGGGNDSITSGSGDDILRGGDGNDIINGNSGADGVEGGAGADTMNGGAGVGDVLVYVNSSSGVTVNLASGTGSGGEAAGDTFSNFDSIFASSHNDTLIGDGNDNWIDGGAGSDSIDGGAGFDFISFLGATTGVTVDLNAGVGSSGEAAGDTYTDIEGIFGTAFGDVLTGDASDNEISGQEGNDTINGGDGVDLIEGNEGNDTLNGGNQNDLIYGGAGNDTLNGGSGVDLLTPGLGADTIDGGADADLVDYSSSTSAVTVNLDTGVGSGGEAAGDTYVNVEAVNGSALNDTLTGDAADNELYGQGGNDLLTGGDGKDFMDGGAGDDTIDGGAGDDAIIGGAGADIIDGGADDDDINSGAGADTIDGGAGIDNVFYTDSGAGVTVNLTTGIGTGGNAEGDTYTNIEDVDGSLFVDTITGDAGDNVLDGWSGVDTISGEGGNDTLQMFQIDGSQVDIFDGGDGEDILGIHSSSITVAYDVDVSALNLSNIEELDLSIEATATIEDITLTAQDVLDVTDGDDILMITGGAEDSVTSTGQTWVAGADQVIGTENYNTYTSGGATLLIDDDITQDIS